MEDSLAATLAKFLGKIHQGDCVAGLKKVPSGSVDLAFADPPFNIGFKYDHDPAMKTNKVIAKLKILAMVCSIK